MGFVTRSIDANSEEARTKGCQTAIAEEKKNLLKNSTYDPSLVREWAEVSAEDPNARRVDVLLLLVGKNQELAGAYRRYKARLVAGGHAVKNATENRVRESLNQLVPTTLCAIRSCCAYSLFHKNGTVIQGGVDGAYLKARLTSPPTWASLPVELCEPEWHGKYIDPVCQLAGALYGLQRAGFDWGWQNRDKMISINYTCVRDIGEDSLYFKWDCMVILYSDDYAVAGPADQAELVITELDEAFGFGSRRPMREYIGIHKMDLNDSGDGMRRCVLHQEGYLRLCVKKYMNDTLQSSLRKISTPEPVREIDVLQSKTADDALRMTTKQVLQEKEEHEEADVDIGYAAAAKKSFMEKKMKTEGKYQKVDFLLAYGVYDCAVDLLYAMENDLEPETGLLAHVAADHVGRLLWVARGTRPDLAHAVNRLSRRLQRWTRLKDLLLDRVMWYISCTYGLGLLFEVCPAERNQMAAVTFVDADFANDIDTTKSTSGACCAVMGPRTKALLNWASKSQPVTSKSPPEAEMVAAVEGTCNVGEPVRLLFEATLGRVVHHAVLPDPDTARTAVEKGYSRRLAYIKKTQRISIGWLHDHFLREDTTLARVDTLKNWSDILTKALDHAKHWGHLARMGLRGSPQVMPFALGE